MGMARTRYFWFAGATPNRLCLSLLFFLPLKSPSRTLIRHSISVCNPLSPFDIAILEPIKRRKFEGNTIFNRPL
jgi:hypothetical protein